MKGLADGLIILSVIAVVLAIIGAFGTDLWLASTQWMLVGIALGIWGMYVKVKD